MEVGSVGGGTSLQSTQAQPNQQQLVSQAEQQQVSRDQETQSSQSNTADPGQRVGTVVDTQA